MKFISSLFLVFIFSANAFLFAQDANKSVKLPAKQSIMQQWVDSVYNSMSLRQKIGQLFMVAAYSGGEKYNQPLIEKLIRENAIGGLIFMQGTPEAQANQTNLYQNISKVPLLIGMDAEWGLGMRLKTVNDLARQIKLGAMYDSTIVYKYGTIVAYQCRRLGVHINFAPDIDINNNPNNPVINFRSFGESKYNVAKHAIQYMRGMQDNGILACAKHFPGHGNTDADSHKELPVVNGSLASLEDLELYPFKRLVSNGVQSIMIAHLQVDAIDNKPNSPITLSYKGVTELLKEKMGYKGLIITDALNMQGVAKYYAPGEVDLKAFMAGNDILLFSQDVPTAVNKIEAALQNGTITEQRIEESVKKILESKFKVGLYKKKTINAVNLTSDLNKYTSAINKQIAKNAITLLEDNNSIIDKIKRNAAKNIAYVGLNTNDATSFGSALKRKGISEQYYVKGKINPALIAKLRNYDAVIVGIHDITPYPGKSFGLNESLIDFGNMLLNNDNSIGVLFGNPYAAKYFCNARSFIVAYDGFLETQTTAAEIITGNLKAKGKLPVSVCKSFKLGDGIVSLTNELGEQNEDIDIKDYYSEIRDTNNSINFNNDEIENNNTSYSNKTDPDSRIITKPKEELPVLFECCFSPEAVGADIAKLDKIDELVDEAIAKKAFPGCRIVAAKDGKVFYDRSFGHLDYSKKKRVDINTPYDVASVTKVAATTLAVMKLYDEGKLNLEATLSDYLKITDGTDKAGLKIKDILLHQAGLKSWIPFYKETIDSTGNQKQEIYSRTKNGKFSIRVADNLFMNAEYLDTMWQRILESPLGARRYEYSDLDFIFLQKVVEKITRMRLDKYVQKEFYDPLGLKYTCFNPSSKFNKAEIPPTEEDSYFRYQTIQGNVHDMAAAMFGGVSGHAGLFSSAEDLGIIQQLLLNGGYYNGKRYFKKSTVDLFTSYQNSTRRGLGFDKPERSGKSNPTADNCSTKTFGHTGFTGTCIWADPQYNIQFVFLSNRTFPTAENKLITRLEVRTKAQQYVYESLGIVSRN